MPDRWFYGLSDSCDKAFSDCLLQTQRKSIPIQPITIRARRHRLVEEQRYTLPSNWTAYRSSLYEQYLGKSGYN